MPTPTCAFLLTLQKTQMLNRLRLPEDQGSLTVSLQHTTGSYIAHKRDGKNDQDDQHQRSSPGQAMPVVVWRQREDVNPQREGVDGPIETGAPERVTQHGE